MWKQKQELPPAKLMAVDSMSAVAFSDSAVHQR